MGTSSEGDRPWQSYNTVYTNAKAGMDGVDKEKVQRIVYEMSKGSKYFENEQRKEAFIKQKIENLRALADKLSDKDISHFQTIANKKTLELEALRDLSKVWLHVDMDAFYAAVETLENPSLRGKPVAVGGMSMISTANYEARKYGVRAAMPGFIACKLCPDLIFVPTNFEKYTFYSGLTREVFRRYDPDFVSMSLDEACLNITEICIHRGIGSDEVAGELRTSIFEETGLTCSAGVAPNRMLAKDSKGPRNFPNIVTRNPKVELSSSLLLDQVCSDINKPNGQFILPNDRKAIMTFISSLPIRKIGGIGKVTEHVLRDVLGIKTCEDMLLKGAFLYALFSSCSSDFFLSIGLGLGGTATPEKKMRKSISSERTFRATKDESFLFQKLGELAETLSNDMQENCLSGRTLTLKLKTAAFEVRTRAVSLQKYIHSKEDILSCAIKILKAELPLSLRLIGLRMSQFSDDKNCPMDPMQKTIVGFLSGGGANHSDMLPNKQDFLELCDKREDQDGLEFSEGQSIQDGELGFQSTDDHSVSSSIAETIKMNDLCLDESKLNDLEGTESLNNAVKRSSASVEEVGLIMWIDDYICSVCSIELPSSFIEERQEHADFHLAEMLQKEESSENRGRFAPEGRLVHKAPHADEGARKKRKCSQKKAKHIPIEAFFS